MCVTKGAPKHPNALTEFQKGIKELWDLMKKHNAVYLADPDFNTELNQFLKDNKIKRGSSTKKQEKYVKDIEKALKNLVVV